MDATDQQLLRSDAPRWRQRWKAAIPPAAMWPILATAMAAMFLLTGRVYRLGYLGYFHLEPTLFPDDLSTRVTYAMSAWTQALALFSHATSKFWNGHVVLGILAPTVALIAIAAALALLRTVREAAGRHIPRAEPPAWLARVGRAVGLVMICVVRWLIPTEADQRPVERAWHIILVVLGVYILILVLGLLLALSMAPFQLAGEHIAGRDATRQFQDRAVVLLHDGAAEKAYRLMECGPAYCALYGSHHAIIVPLSELKRAESPSPDNR